MCSQHMQLSVVGSILMYTETTCTPKIKVNLPVFVYNDSHLSLKLLFYSVQLTAKQCTIMHMLKSSSRLLQEISIMCDISNMIFGIKCYLLHVFKSNLAVVSLNMQTVIP